MFDHVLTHAFGNHIGIFLLILDCPLFVVCVAQASAGVSTGEEQPHDLFRNEPIVLAVRVRLPREILDHVCTHIRNRPTPTIRPVARNWRPITVLVFPISVFPILIASIYFIHLTAVHLFMRD